MSGCHENANPVIYQKREDRPIESTEGIKSDKPDFYDSSVVFDLVRDISDPEHPLTLEQLHVVQEEHIEVSDELNTVTVQFTPTIPHCSMASLIGLSIRVKLLRSLPPRFKVSVKVTPGTHVGEIALNKQLADKERIAAALENKHLAEVINECIEVI